MGLYRYLPIQYIVYTLAGTNDKNLEDYESEFCEYKTGYEYNNMRVDTNVTLGFWKEKGLGDLCDKIYILTSTDSLGSDSRQGLTM